MRQRQQRRRITARTTSEIHCNDGYVDARKLNRSCSSVGSRELMIRQQAQRHVEVFGLADGSGSREDCGKAPANFSQDSQHKDLKSFVWSAEAAAGRCPDEDHLSAGVPLAYTEGCL